MTAKATYYSVAGLNKSLRRLPKEAKVELRNGAERIARKVAADAQARAKSQGKLAAIVAPTIRSGRDTVPIVKMGSASRLPEAGGDWQRTRSGSRQTIGDVIWGAEFGGGRRAPQFLPWRGSGDGAGYFLWPTVKADRGYIEDTYNDAMAEAEASVFKGEKRKHGR